MSLGYIIQELKSDINVQLTGTDAAQQRSWLLRKINKAAKLLWESNDLVLALREQYFEFPTDDSQVTLPYYVGQLRGARRPSMDLRDPIILNDMRPRYHYNSWGGIGLNTFRIKQETCIGRALTSAVPLTIEVCDAQSVDVVVSITGETNQAAKGRAVATIAAGDTTASIPTIFTSFTSITKNVITSCDVGIYAGTNELLAAIPNILLASRYLLVNIAESGCFLQYSSSCYCVEILYKPYYLPFINDEDEFQAPGYDDDIVEATKSVLEKSDERRAGMLSALNFSLANKQSEFAKGQTVPMNMAPDPFVRSYENMFERRGR